MRPVSLLALLPILVACGRQQPIDCTHVDIPEVERCYNKNRPRGEAAALVACLPFSQPLSTSGIWVVGFEKNDFIEAARPSKQDLWTLSTGASLIVDEALFNRTHETQALEVEVRGRRALCPIGVVNSYPIAVEKLRIKRRIT